jgi:hypothetical protein
MILARIGATWLLSRGDASVPASRPHRSRPYAGMGTLASLPPRG